MPRILNLLYGAGLGNHFTVQVGEEIAFGVANPAQDGVQLVRVTFSEPQNFSAPSVKAKELGDSVIVKALSRETTFDCEFTVHGQKQAPVKGHLEGEDPGKGGAGSLKPPPVA